MFQEKFVVQNHKLVILWLMNKLDEFSHSFPLKLDPFINAELRRINDTWENIFNIFPIVVGNVFTDSCWFSVFVLQCGVTKVSRFRWRKLWDQYRGAGPSPTEVDQVDNDKNFYLIEDLKARIIQFELEVAICIFWQKSKKKQLTQRILQFLCTIWPKLLYKNGLLRIFPGIPFLCLLCSLRFVRIGCRRVELAAVIVVSHWLVHLDLCTMTLSLGPWVKKRFVKIECRRVQLAAVTVVSHFKRLHQLC